MRLTNKAARFLSLVVLVSAPLFLTANQAVAQSTDSCEPDGAAWLKWRITQFFYGGDTPFIYASRAVACNLAGFNYQSSAACTGASPSSGCNKLPWTPWGNYTDCKRSTGTIIHGVINRTQMSNPVTQCPANPQPNLLSVPPDEPCERVGNPCAPSSGTKYLDEIDYVGPDGLDLRRSYSTARSFQNTLVPLVPAFGTANWLHSYESTLHQFDPGLTGGIKWVAKRHDGTLLYFNASGTELLNHAATGAASTVTPRADGGGWDVRLANGDVEVYLLSGNLTSIKKRTGLIITVVHNSTAKVSRVYNSFGHDLDFFYDAQLRLDYVRDPAGGEIHYAYDASGRLETVTYPDLTVRRYHYEEPIPNLLTGITDENGQRFATYDYDSQGRVISSEHAGGAGRYEFSYSGASAPYSTIVEDPLGTSRTYSAGNVNGVYKLQSIAGPVCNSCGRSQDVDYDANGNVSQRTDFEGNVTTYVFSSPRNLESSRTEAFGTARARTISTQWHATYRLPTQIDEPGRRTTFTHDSAGNVLTKTVLDTGSSESRSWTYTYNAFGRVLTENGPRTDVTDVTTNTYYSCTTGTQCGQVNTVTNALGHVTTYNTYNAHGQPLTITDPNGVVTTLTYDARQRLKTRTVGGELTTFDYWPTRLLQKATLPDGSFLLYGYDAAQRLTSIVDSEGNGIEYTLDAMGNRTAEEVTDPSSTLVRTRTRVFNTLNQLAQEIGAAGGPSVTTTYGYDDNGNVTSIAAPLNRNSTNAYDELDRLTQVTDPESGITLYGYNALDQLISVTDPRSLVTSYSYNALGDLKQQVSPDTGTTNNTYDSGGNLKTSTDARSKTGTYAYDAVNRVTSLAYPDQTITYTYDTGTNQKGRLTGLASSGATLTWSYDPKGRVLSKTQVSNGNTKTISYQYNAAGQLTQITTPSNKVIVYGYANGKVSSITVGGTTLLNNVVYESFGPVGGWTWGNGTLAVRTFDLDGRIAQVDSAGLRTYTWDDADRITAIADAQNSSLNQGYGYDDLDRLTSVTKTTGNQSFTYDSNGNRLTYGDGGSSSTYTIAGTSNRLSSIAGSQARTYSYNAVGAVTGDGSKTFAYSDRERMKSATVSGSTWNYYHDGLGQRVRKKLAPSGNHYYVYDEAGHLIGEYNGNTLIQETVWLGDIPVATLRGSNIFYVHSDHLNAPRTVTQPSNNAIRWRWDRDPFGATAVNENPSGLGVFSYNLRLPGQFYDAETGLNYNYFRDYDPAIGRYVESDPVGLFAGTNTYSYAYSSPQLWFDPSGLTSIDIDVSSGQMLVDPEVNGRAPYSMPISSGSGQCQNNPKCMKNRNEGPVPGGDYRLNIAEISKPGIVGTIARQFRGDWGSWRAPLHPLPATETFGRSGFFLHGGRNRGTAGCIDFGGGIFGNQLTDQFLQDLRDDPDGIVPVRINE
jgi:RHS repeat-associated protein